MSSRIFMARSTFSKHNAFARTLKDDVGVPISSSHKKRKSLLSEQLRQQKETDSVGKVEPHSRICSGHDKHARACLACGICTVAQDTDGEAKPHRVSNIPDSKTRRFGLVPSEINNIEFPSALQLTYMRLVLDDLTKRHQAPRQ